jgi:hypothetical protein
MDTSNFLTRQNTTHIHWCFPSKIGLDATIHRSLEFSSPDAVSEEFIKPIGINVCPVSISGELNLI